MLSLKNLVCRGCAFLKYPSLNTLPGYKTKCRPQRRSSAKLKHIATGKGEDFFFVTFCGKSNQKPPENEYPAFSGWFPDVAFVLLWFQRQEVYCRRLV